MPIGRGARPARPPGGGRRSARRAGRARPVRLFLRTDHARLPLDAAGALPAPGRIDGSGTIADRLRRVAGAVSHDASARAAAEHAARELRRDRPAWTAWVRYERAGPEEALFVQLISGRYMNAAEVARSMRGAANTALD